MLALDSSNITMISTTSCLDLAGNKFDKIDLGVIQLRELGTLARLPTFFKRISAFQKIMEEC